MCAIEAEDTGVACAASSCCWVFGDAGISAVTGEAGGIVGVYATVAL